MDYALPPNNLYETYEQALKAAAQAANFTNYYILKADDYTHNPTNSRTLLIPLGYKKHNTPEKIRNAATALLLNGYKITLTPGLTLAGVTQELAITIHGTFQSQNDYNHWTTLTETELWTDPQKETQ